MKSFKIPSLKTFMVWALLLPLVGGWGAACTSTNPEPSLPPETQEGRNTFGCLINGKVWIPDFGGAGDIYNTPLTTAKYDPFRQGLFEIAAKKIEGDKTYRMSIGILATPISGKTYEFIRADSFQIGDFNMGYSYSKNTITYNGCRYVTTALTYFKGKTKITKFDLQRRIAAGTFECTLKTKNCDTVKITQGRFDMTF
jgi:hypothetical protein